MPTSERSTSPATTSPALPKLVLKPTDIAFLGVSSLGHPNDLRYLLVLQVPQNLRELSDHWFQLRAEVLYGLIVDVGDLHSMDHRVAEVIQTVKLDCYGLIDDPIA